jgi:hypothetical protein
MSPISELDAYQALTALMRLAQHLCVNEHDLPRLPSFRAAFLEICR